MAAIRLLFKLHGLTCPNCCSNYFVGDYFPFQLSFLQRHIAHDEFSMQLK